MKNQVFALIFFLFPLVSSAQNSEYSTVKIADSLKENANAVVRLDQMDITIASQRSMNIKTQRVVSVFNE
jgi:hypothetical protein